MTTLTIGKLTLESFHNLVEIQECPIADYAWTQVNDSPLTKWGNTILEYITHQLTTEPAHLLNEATIWARAIYPLLSLAESGEIHARAQVALSAQYKAFLVTGIADGALGKTIGSRMVVPYLVVVEAKRGIEGEDPIPQLYGQLLAAAHLNWRKNPTQPQIMFGAYTIADNWSFVRAEANHLDGDRPTLKVEYSREYSQRTEGESILRLLRSIVQSQSH